MELMSRFALKVFRDQPRTTPGANHLLKNVNVTIQAMAPHSSTLAWKIPWTEKPGGLQSMGSLRVGHD